MDIAAHIEHEIFLLNQELHELVTLKGFALTHADVVNKSAELDLLIYRAMSSQSKRFHNMQAS